MSKPEDNLNDLLGLAPLVEETITFRELLASLKEHPERADTAAALFVRAVKEAGEVDIEQASPERRPYLEMLRSMKIPAYSAFDHVRGSQRVVARLMKHYEAAAQNGYQLRQMLTIFGGPGSGKSFLVDAMIALLEGQIVYAVKDCPVHENPLNLLNLLKPAQLKQLAKELGMVDAEGKDQLAELMKATLQPCAHCFQKVMGVGDEEKAKKPNLGNLQVEALRLSSRNAGISQWTPSAPGLGCSLQSSLMQGSRGLNRLQEAFSAKGAEAGSVSQLQVLLEATEGRRMPSGGGNSCGTSTGFVPLDSLIVLETNEGAWNQFIKDQQDPDAFTRRTRVLTMLYNTVVCEEEAAYKDFIKKLKAVPSLDPFALHMAAMLAVASRMVEDTTKLDAGIDLSTRIRMYNGESIVVPKKQSTVVPSNPWGGGLASMGTKPQSDEAAKNVQVADIWTQVGDDEGKYGLNMGFMLSCISQICELGMASKHKCVTALAVMNYLYARIEQHMKSPGLTSQETKVLERCKVHLKMASTRLGEPGIIEKEYRRLLREQMLLQFAPDFESRANEIFSKYRSHATAWAGGHKKVFDERHQKNVDIDVAFLEQLETSMGKTYVEDREQFRRGLSSDIVALLQAANHLHQGDGPCDHVVIDWHTQPDLEKAIAKRLNSEIADKVQKLLTAEDVNLSVEEKAFRKESIDRLKQLGYSDHCLKAALEYFKEFELWKSA